MMTTILDRLIEQSAENIRLALEIAIPFQLLTDCLGDAVSKMEEHKKHNKE